MASLTTPLLFVGAMSAILSLLKVLRFMYIYTRPSSIGRYRHLDGDKQAWALVTGASEGIGLAFAKELARRGFNVVVHGRNGKKLQGIINALAKEFPERSFRIAVLDGLVGGSRLLEGFNRMVEGLKDINLTVLVNNLGGPPPSAESIYQTFDSVSTTDIDAGIEFNVRFCLQLTSAMLPLLINHQPSLIVTMGSMAEEGTPWLTVYSGSKAFQMAWCKALAREMKITGHDIEVLGIRTAQVTNCSHNKNPASLIMPDSKTYAAAALDRVGCGQTVINGYWFQGIMKAFLDIIPNSMIGSLIRQGTEKLRNIELEKLEKLKKV